MEGGCFAGEPVGYERKALERGSVGQPGVLLYTENFERWLTVDTDVERPFLWEFCEGNEERGLLCWGP